MVERKLFKTKLCVLFRRGRCSRQNCSFAHGEAELRRFSGSFHGKRDFGDGDLRDRLDRRHSPRRTYSPVGDARGRDTVRAAEHGPSRSPEKERGQRKKRRFDGLSDISGSLRISDGVEHEVEEGNLSIQSRSVLEEQVKQVHLDINRLDHRKSDLQAKLEGRVQEVESLTSKIQELEAQLHKEKEDNQRVLSKIKKFVMEHKRHSKIQDQLKKSEAQLRKLGDDLGSDINKITANEEDSSINIVSDEEASGFPVRSYNEKQNDVLQSIERQEGDAGIYYLPVDLTKKVRAEAPIRSRKVSRWNIPAKHSYDKKIDAVVGRNGQPSYVAHEDKYERRTSDNLLFADTSKSLASRLVLPPTSMAARAVDDEEVEIELDENLMENMTDSRVDIGVTHETNGLPLTLPPKPPILKTNYSMYEGDDESIDVDGIDE